MSSKSLIASSTLLALVVVPALGLAACQDDSGVGASGELGQRLATPTTLDIISPSRAEIAGRDSAGNAVSVGPLAVDGGSISLHTNDAGDIVVEDFVVHFADFLADDGTLAANPRKLTSIKVTLGRALVYRDAWSLSGRGAHATESGDLRLDWSIVDENGNVVPLASQKFDAAQVSLRLQANDDGSVSARVYLELSGQIMANWGVHLSDFTLELSATNG